MSPGPDIIESQEHHIPGKGAVFIIPERCISRHPHHHRIFSGAFLPPSA